MSKGTDAAPARDAPAREVAPLPAAVAEPVEGSVEIHEGDNLEVIRALPDASFTLIYLDPPFNTGRPQERSIETARSRHPSPSAGAPSVRRQSPDETSGDTHGLVRELSSHGNAPGERRAAG
ncbi:MAG TPA: hypothetical protein VJU58_16990, partial [Microbacterium sp.]|nr:hypothetical protein [Microbacterium sp.]